MTYPPPRSPDDEPYGPEPEQLSRGEIDLTGVVRQDQALVDVIGDAIAEAEADDGIIPDWGARPLARALANERNDPLSGALHQFAITGRANTDAMARELLDLYEHTADEELREWINWLGTYVLRLQLATVEQAAANEQTLDLPSAHDELSAHLLEVFAEADARGAPIDTEAAQAVAGLLAVFFAPTSEMARFADTGDAHSALLHRECQSIHRLAEHAAGLVAWIEHFEHHLTSRADLGRTSTHPGHDESAGELPETVPDASGSPSPADPEHQANSRTGVHQDAFQAYLQLPDAIPERDDVLVGFHNAYFTSVASMTKLRALVRDGMATDKGTLEAELDDATLLRLARAAWDIVEADGRFHLFNK
jgi:hypothetical protein